VRGIFDGTGNGCLLWCCPHSEMVGGKSNSSAMV
jgi:hypothetical protein